MADGQVAGIVLAAGSSRRMQGNKLLLRLAGESVLRRAVQTAADAGLDPLIVVLAPDAAALRAELAGLPARAVENPQAERGMSTSLRVGVASLPDDVDAVVVLLADMPFVSAAQIRALCVQAGAAPLAASLYGEVVAPPYLYRRALFGELLALDGDGCGKKVYKRHQHDAVRMACPPEALADLDEPADWQRAQTLLGGV